MLALTRKTGQSIIINDDIEITVVDIKGDQVRLGIEAPKSMKIFRKEIIDEVLVENKRAAAATTSSTNELDAIMQKLKNK